MMRSKKQVSWQHILFSSVVDFNINSGNVTSLIKRVWCFIAQESTVAKIQQHKTIFLIEMWLPANEQGKGSFKASDALGSLYQAICCVRPRLRYNRLYYKRGYHLTFDHGSQFIWLSQAWVELAQRAFIRMSTTLNPWVDEPSWNRTAHHSISRSD